MSFVDFPLDAESELRRLGGHTPAGPGRAAMLRRVLRAGLSQDHPEHFARLAALRSLALGAAGAAALGLLAFALVPLLASLRHAQQAAPTQPAVYTAQHALLLSFEVSDPAQAGMARAAVTARLASWKDNGTESTQGHSRQAQVVAAERPGRIDVLAFDADATAVNELCGGILEAGALTFADSRQAAVLGPAGEAQQTLAGLREAPATMVGASELRVFIPAALPEVESHKLLADWQAGRVLYEESEPLHLGHAAIPGTEVWHPWLGVRPFAGSISPVTGEARELDDALKMYLDLPQQYWDTGVLLDRVYPESPALAFGLQGKDLLLTVAVYTAEGAVRQSQRGLESASQLRELLASAEPGERFVFGLLRDGSYQELELLPGQHPGEFSFKLEAGPGAAAERLDSREFF